MTRHITTADKEAARRLRQIWKRKKSMLGLTQQKLAKEFGMSNAAISQYLNGGMTLGTDIILKLAQRLGVSPTEIRPELGQYDEIPTPVMTHWQGESLELSPEDVRIVRLLQQASVSKRELCQRLIEAAIKESDCGYNHEFLLPCFKKGIMPLVEPVSDNNRL